MPEPAFTLPGIRVHDALEWMFTFGWNLCSRCPGIRTSSFRTLLRLLSNIVRNKCRRPEAGPDEPTFDVTTTPDSKQQRAYDLLKGITV